MTPWITVIGIGDGGLDTLSPDARAALDAAEAVFGGRRHLAMLDQTTPERLPWRSPFADSAADVLARRGRPTAVLASGDPSWFGVGKWLRSLLPAEEMRVLPAPSAFSLAAARLGWAIEDCECLTIHGRPLEALTPVASPNARLLIYSENGASPAAIAAHLARLAFSESRLTVLEHLGGKAERVRSASAARFALADIADLNLVAVECRPDSEARMFSRIPGLPDDAFRHDGMITKRVARALALAALEPQPGALLWDVGAGCGSISVEWLRAGKAMRAVAIEPNPERRALVAENAARLAGPGLTVVGEHAPEAFAGLEAPDAVFIGGGLTAGAFEPAFAALKAGGRMVANAVTLEGETILLGLHARHGGELLRLSVERADALGSYRAWRPTMPVVHWHLTKDEAP